MTEWPFHLLSFREKQSALEEIITTNKMVLEMQSREKALKEQLSLYTTKYEEFQNSLKSSSDIFTTYKLEIEKVKVYFQHHQCGICSIIVIYFPDG